MTSLRERDDKLIKTLSNLWHGQKLACQARLHTVGIIISTLTASYPRILENFFKCSSQIKLNITILNSLEKVIEKGLKKRQINKKSIFLSIHSNESNDY